MPPLGVSPPVKGAQKIRVLIAERNRMASQLLAESLERDSRFEVIAVPGAAELLSVATIRKPDVAVISADFVSVPRKGLQIARALTIHDPGIRLVVLLDVPARESVIASFRAGARGVFCRTEPVSEFRTCLERVSRGEIWARSIEAEHLLDVVRSSPGCDVTGNDVGVLSKREVEVAECAVQGHTNRQIAEQLRLSEHTVKNYLFRIFEKLGVSNRMELFFLLSTHNKDVIHPAAGIDTAGDANSLEIYLKAAQEGSAAAQFIVGLAYFEGRGVEKNEHSAYSWLRMAEENSSELREHSQMLILELKAKMKLQDIQALEQSLTTRNNKMLAGKKPADLVKGHVGVHKLAG